MSFISYTLFCALAYLIWPLHSSNVLLHSSLVMYLVSTFCTRPQFSDHAILSLLTLFYWDAFYVCDFNIFYCDWKRRS